MQRLGGRPVRLLVSGAALALVALAGAAPPPALAAPTAGRPHVIAPQVTAGASGSVSSAAAAGSTQADDPPLMPIQDPGFAATVQTGDGGFTNPYWTQSSSGEFATIDNSYVRSTGWTGGEYTADLCGYSDCDDRADQGGYVADPPVTLIAPDNVSAATLTFDVAYECLLPTSCSGGELRVGLWDQAAGTTVEQDFTSKAVPGLYTDYPPTQYSLDTTAFLQAAGGQAYDVFAIGTTPTGDGTEWFVDDIQLAVTSVANPPTHITATSTAAGQAKLTWVAPADAAVEGVTGYTLTTYSDLGVPVGTPQPISGVSTTSATVTGSDAVSFSAVGISKGDLGVWELMWNSEPILKSRLTSLLAPAFTCTLPTGARMTGGLSPKPWASAQPASRSAAARRAVVRLIAWHPWRQPLSPLPLSLPPWPGSAARCWIDLRCSKFS